jgi:ribonuclease M5
VEKIKISLPIIVEGRYDKSTLSGFIEGTIITTDGFSVFNNKEKQSLIRRVAKDGIIVLTDSDGGGKQIRSFLSGIIPKDKIHNLYIPKIEGKESRKRKASKAGTLGVEGMEKDVLTRLLEPFSNGNSPARSSKMITKVDFFCDKLTGCDNAAANRARLCEMCELPTDMTPNALLEAMNLLYGYDGYKELVCKLSDR